MWKNYKQSGVEKELEEFNLLTAELSVLAKEEMLSESQKSLMKANLFEAIDLMEESAVQGVSQLGVSGPAEQAGLVKRIQAVSAGRMLSNSQRKLIYEDVMQSVSEKAWSWRSVFWAFRSWRAGVASFLIFFFALASFTVAPFELRVTRASKWTFLEKVQGDVFVNRDGRLLSVDEDFTLEEGDLIFTKGESFVTIRYLDDSVTRLGENTSLEIKKLYVRPDNAVQTEVELSLLGGYLWASVYNLINNQSSFVIETGNARANVSNKASFEMKSLADTTTLTVFDNVVDVSNKKRATNIRPVVAGFKAEVKGEPVYLASLPSDIQIEKNSKQADKWVISNLDLDKKHQEKLMKENLEFAASSVASDSALVGVLADFKDTTKSLFANAEIEQARQRFLGVHLGIIKAQELLTKADSANQLRRQAVPLMLQYKTAIKEIMANFADLQNKDSEQASKLLAKMKEEVDLQRKALSLVMPGEKLYMVKEAVNDGGFYLAVDAAQKAGYLLDRAKNRLLETQTLIAKNDLKGAEAAFRNYLRNLDDLVKAVEQSQKSEIEGSLFALIDEQIKQFKSLNAIESELLGKNDTKLSVLVSRVKLDSAEKLVDIVRTYRKNSIPFRVVMELRNTIEEYFKYSPVKLAMQAKLDQVLNAYSEPSTAIVPEVVEIILDKESSADLGADVLLKVEIPVVVLPKDEKVLEAECKLNCEKK
jgi:hypothetical protein